MSEKTETKNEQLTEEEQVKKITEEAKEITNKFYKSLDKNVSIDSLLLFVSTLLLDIEDKGFNREQQLSHIRTIMRQIKPEVHPCFAVVGEFGYNPMIDITKDELIIVEQDVEELKEETKRTIFNIKESKFERNDFELDEEILETLSKVYQRFYEEFKIVAKKTQAVESLEVKNEDTQE